MSSLQLVEDEGDSDDDVGIDELAQVHGSEYLRVGWLKKRTKMGLWRRRYAALTDSSLLYFKSPHDMRRPRGVIPLIGYCIKLTLPFTLTPC